MYVDDESQLWDEMEMGRRWNGKKMEWKEEWFNEDKEKGEETDKRMMREILKMANTIEPDIEVTADIPSENDIKQIFSSCGRKEPFVLPWGQSDDNSIKVLEDC